MTTDLAILGFGIMGERLARAAAAHPAWRVAAAWDPDPAAAARLAAAAPGARFCATMEEAIAAAQAVHVASPPRFHLDQGRVVLQAGRALLLEKPLSTDVAAARGFVAWAAGRPAGVNFPFVSSPAVARLAEWRAGIGAVREARITLRFGAWPRPWQRDAAPWLCGAAQGGFLREVGSHFLFLAGRLLGALALESGAAERPAPDAAEAAVAARLRAGGVTVLLDGRVAPGDPDDHNLFELHGAAGAIRLRDWSVAERLEGGAWRPDPDAMPQDQARPLTPRGQLDKLAALARGEDAALATLPEALAVQEVVEAILAAPR